MFFIGGYLYLVRLILYYVVIEGKFLDNILVKVIINESIYKDYLM